MLIWVTGWPATSRSSSASVETARGLHGPFATYVVSAGAFAAPSEETLARTIALIDEMPTAAGRGVMCASAAFLAQALGRPDIAAEIADRALAESPEPTSTWVSAWSHKASLHLARGELVDALVCAAANRADSTKARRALRVRPGARRPRPRTAEAGTGEGLRTRARGGTSKVVVVLPPRARPDGCLVG